jgi:Putative restriction endonuclease
MSAVSTTEAWPARGQPFTVSDLNRKKAAYQRFGVPSYWIVDPDLQKLSITAYELREGQYVKLGTATDRETLSAKRPFRVKVVPAALLAGLPDRHP